MQKMLMLLLFINVYLSACQKKHTADSSTSKSLLVSNAIIADIQWACITQDYSKPNLTSQFKKKIHECDGFKEEEKELLFEKLAAFDIALFAITPRYKYTKTRAPEKTDELEEVTMRDFLRYLKARRAILDLAKEHQNYFEW